MLLLPLIVERKGNQKLCKLKTRREKSKYRSRRTSLNYKSLHFQFREWNFMIAYFFWSSSSNAMKGIFNAFFQRAKQCMKWMGKMQFRCIIRQFTYLNSFFGIPLFPWFCVRLPFLSYRLIFFQLEVLCRCSFRLVRQAREIQNSKKKPRKKKDIKILLRFWLNSIKNCSEIRVFIGNFSRVSF